MVLPCFGDLKTSRLCSPRWFLNIHAVWSHSAQRIHCQEYHGQILGTFLESTCASTYTTAMAQWQFKYSRTSLYTQLLLRKIKHSYTQPFINSSAPIKNNRHQLYTHLPPLHQMQSQKKKKKNHSNKSVLLLMCWCDITAAEGAAESPSSEPGSVSEWATDSSSPGSQSSGSSHPPTPSSSLFFPPSSVSPFLSPSQHHFSHSLTVLYSHSIKFKQRHAGLFIGEWCFFISLCLFVALRCTEGFLAADVSSAALQRIGGYVRQKDRKKDTKWQCETKEG